MSDVRVLNPATHTIELWDAETAMRKFVAGDVQLLPGERYNLTGGDGEVFEADANDVPNVMRQHKLRFATRPERLRVEESDQELQAFAEGALNGPLMGAGDAVLVAAGVDPERIEARKQANPNARMAGELGGIVATAAFGGGSGAAARALSATPGGMAIRGGLVAERIAADALAARGFTGAAGTVVSRAAGAAVEGAAYGVGMTISEASLGNVELNAETLMAGAGTGALLSGVAGGTFAAAPFIARKGVEGVDQLYTRLTGKPAPSGFAAWYGKLKAKVVAAFTNNDEAVLRRASDPGPEGRKFVLDATETQAEIDKLILKLRDGLDDEVRQADFLLREGLVEMKPEMVRKLVPETNAPAIAQAIDSEFLAVRRIINELDQDVGVNAAMKGVRDRIVRVVDNAEANLLRAGGIDPLKPKFITVPGKGPGGIGVRRARLPMRVKDLATARVPKKGDVLAVGVDEFGATVPGRRPVRVLDATDPQMPSSWAADAFMQLDAAKRAIDEFVRPLATANRKGQLDYNLKLALDGFGGSSEGLFALRKRFQDLLEREDLFGEMASRQASLNRAASDLIGEANQFNQIFARDNLALKRREVDGGKIRGYVNKITDPVNDRGVQSLQGYQRSAKAFADQMEAMYSLGDTHKLAVKTLRRRAEEVANVNNRVSEIMEAQHLLREMMVNENQLLGGGAMLAGPVVGGVVGGLPGAVVGAVGMMLFRPARSIQAKAGFIRQLEAAKVAMRTRVNGIIAGKPVAKQDFTTRAIAPATVAMTNGKTPEERREAFRTRVSEVAGMTANPQALQEHLQRQTAGLVLDFPNTAVSLHTKTRQHLQALRAAIPRPPQGANAILGTQPDLAALVSDEDIQNFADVDYALQDPIGAMLDPARTNARVVSTVEQYYPELMQEIRELVYDAVATNPDVPYETQVRLSVMLGVPTDPSVSGLSIVQSSRVYQAPQQQESGGRSPKVKSRTKTKREDTVKLPTTPDEQLP